MQALMNGATSPPDAGPYAVSDGPLDPITLFSPDRLRPIEYVIDGFLGAGSLVVAGDPGVGKTTNLLPLAASVAHLTPDSWGFRPELRRRVVWITEAVEQSGRVLYSLLHDQSGSHTEDSVSHWFQIRRAQRLTIDQRANELRHIDEQFTYRLALRDGETFRVRPLVILDTTSATVRLDDENANAEVSDAIAAMREAAPGLCCWMIAHSPKNALGSGSVRGASAWAGDVEATCSLTLDQATGTRLLKLGKVRFAPLFDEVTFHSGPFRNEKVATPWGTTQTVPFMHGIPSKGNTAARIAADHEDRQRIKGAIANKADEAREAEVLRALHAGFSVGHLVGKLALRQAVGGRAQAVDQALQRLILRGQVTEIEVPKKFRKAPNARCVYLKAGDDADDLFERMHGPACLSPDSTVRDTV